MQRPEISCALQHMPPVLFVILWKCDYRDILLFTKCHNIQTDLVCILLAQMLQMHPIFLIHPSTGIFAPRLPGFLYLLQYLTASVCVFFSAFKIADCQLFSLAVHHTRHRKCISICKMNPTHISAFCDSFFRNRCILDNFFYRNM